MRFKGISFNDRPLRVCIQFGFICLGLRNTCIPECLIDEIYLHATELCEWLFHNNCGYYII